MSGESSNLRVRLRKFAASGTVGPPRAKPLFDEDYLVRCLAYLLRHSANDRGVALDSRGWASVDEVVRATRRMHWTLGDLTPGRLIDFVLRKADDRFEVYGDQIRARYGHSITGLEIGEPESPPELLFHGTSCDAVPSILELGLRPMGRSHVHLTSDRDYAERIARAAEGEGAVLRVRAGRAADHGSVFRKASSHVWLADRIEPQFIVK